jgi:hypothetical protein
VPQSGKQNCHKHPERKYAKHREASKVEGSLDLVYPYEVDCFVATCMCWQSSLRRQQSEDVMLQYRLMRVEMCIAVSESKRSTVE